MRKVYFLIPVLTVLLLTGCAHMHGSMKTDLQRGRALFQQQHYKEAYAQLMPLAEKGVPEAQYTVGYLHYYGYGVKKNRERAFFWIRKAAKAGNAHALDALALISQDGPLPSAP